MSRAFVLSILLFVPVASVWGENFYDVESYHREIPPKGTLGVWRDKIAIFLESGAINNLRRATKQYQPIRRNHSVGRASRIIHYSDIRQGHHNVSQSYSWDEPSLAEALSDCGQETNAPLNTSLLSSVDINSQPGSDYPYCNLADYNVIRDAVLAEKK